MILIYTFPFLDANDFDEDVDWEARRLGGHPPSSVDYGAAGRTEDRTGEAVIVIGY